METRYLILLLVGFVVAAIGLLYQRLRAKALPDVPEDVFMARFQHRYTGERDLVLKARGAVASALGIPAAKLSPEQELHSLSRRFGFLGQFSVGYNDLMDEVLEKRQVLNLRSETLALETVGELVEELARGERSRSA